VFYVSVGAAEDLSFERRLNMKKEALDRTIKQLEDILETLYYWQETEKFET
jgi:hypothetical protein